MKKTKLFMIIVAVLLMLPACERPVELETPETNDLIESIDVDIDEEIVGLLQELTFTDGNTPKSSRKSFDYVVINGALYLYRHHGKLYHLNSATGYLTGLCDDPLCQHKVVTCIDQYFVYCALPHDNKIYMYGTRMIPNDDKGLMQEEFIGYYSIKDAEYTFLDTWEIILGYSTASSIQIYEDEIYYMKKESDTVNNLWKVNVNRKNSAELVSIGNQEFISGFVVHDDHIYYNYRTGEAVYRTDMKFENQQVVMSDIVSIFTLIDDSLIYSNFGVYDTRIEWDVEEYVPSETPYNIYKRDIDDINNRETIAMHIMGAVSMGLEHSILTAEPDNPTYLGMEEKNGKKIYYVNKNSGCILVGNAESGEMRQLDLSEGLGINYTINGIYYIDDEKCILDMGAAYKETDEAGIYIVVDYDTDNPKFYKVDYEQ